MWPLQFANPTLLKLYRQQCDALLAALNAQRRLHRRDPQLPAGDAGRFPPVEEAADHLHMSPRTLRRRLDEEGTNYQRIVHELRRQLAETYLRDSMLSIAEIADMLGYNDVSNFRRAFLKLDRPARRRLPPRHARHARRRGKCPVGPIPR